MIKNKVIVVTGGAGLIGQEFIKAIIEQKGIAIIADINKDLGNKIKKILSKELNTKNIDFIKLDITSKKSLKRCIKYLDVKYCDFVENLGLNLGGYFTTGQQFSKYFKKQSYGNIINISSIYGVIAPKFEIYNGTDMTTPVEYSAIKSGLIHLTKYMAKYFKGMNIKVNTLSPGGILNNQPEEFLNKYKKECLNKGMLNGNDLSGTLVYLLSDMSSYVNGQNIVVDDGFSI